MSTDRTASDDPIVGLDFSKFTSSERPLELLGQLGPDSYLSQGNLVLTSLTDMPFTSMVSSSLTWVTIILRIIG